MLEYAIILFMSVSTSAMNEPKKAETTPKIVKKWRKSIPKVVPATAGKTVANDKRNIAYAPALIITPLKSADIDAGASE
jgi:hypothetical protein